MMQKLGLVTFVCSLGFVASGHARAQDGDSAAAPPAANSNDDEAEEAEAEPAPPRAPEMGARTGKTAEVAIRSEATEASPQTSASGGVDEHTGTPRRAPVYGKREDWSITPYGYARFDAIEDSTQSFEDGLQPFLIARAGSYRGDHQRSILTARDSRIGLFVTAPVYQGLRTYAQIELDFFGLVPTDARKHDATVFGPLRIRHAFFKLETPVVDVLAGQTWDVFGWGTHFFPASGAFLGVPGQVYHRNPQLRVEKTLALGDLEIKAAVAAARGGQRDSGFPDGQAGLKVAFNGWTGAAMAGLGNASIAPISLGASALYRRFQLPAFREEPGSEEVEEQGYGFVAQALIPVIPAHKSDERSNALTLTGEFSIGTGISDMYTGMDGGSRLPQLPNPGGLSPAPVYQQNIDPGMVTFDSNYRLQTINWRGFVAGLQYYLPVGGGRIWISGVYSRIQSDNLAELTPVPHRALIFKKMEYIDATVGVAVTPALVLGLSGSTLKQTFGDVTAQDPAWGESAPTGDVVGSLGQPGTGGKAVSARNNRGQLTAIYMF